MRQQNEIQDEEFKTHVQSHNWGQNFKFKSDGGEDYQIYQDIILGLYRSVFKTDHLVISVNQGIVYLSGELESAHARDRIQEFIRQINGVKNIKCHIGLAQ